MQFREFPDSSSSRFESEAWLNLSDINPWIGVSLNSIYLEMVSSCPSSFASIFIIHQGCEDCILRACLCVRRIGLLYLRKRGVQVPLRGWRCCNVGSGSGKSLRLLVLVLFLFVRFVERSWDVLGIPSFVFCVRRLLELERRCRAGCGPPVDGRVGGWSKHHTNM